ncbi:MAG: peptidoglycan editing factor PgeF [Pseudomonadota bacterium]
MTPLTGIPVLWPAPVRVRCLSTQRAGGVSEGAWGLAGGARGGLNLGMHVGDAALDVQTNRDRLRSVVGVPIQWLEQIHGTRVFNADEAMGQSAEPVSPTPVADAAVCTQAGRALCIMTADCLPVLFSDLDGHCIGAAHAGWRGLQAGVLEATVCAMRARLGAQAPLLAWLGPAIGPQAFEVGEEVREAFAHHDRNALSAFARAKAPGKWLADLEKLARQRLQACGGIAVYGGGMCTVNDPVRFFSHRRDRVSGRMASLIWLAR